MDTEDTKAEAVDQKEAFWQRTLEAWKDSGLSGCEFQRRNNLSKNTFVYWKRKLMPQIKKVRHFVPVAVRRGLRCPSMSGSDSIRLRIGELYTVEVTAGFDAQTLREVLTVVQDCAR